MLSLADAKSFLNIPSGTVVDDSEILDIIGKAYSAVTDRVGDLDPITRTDRVHGSGSRLLVPHGPVNSITSITPVGGSALDGTQFFADGRSIQHTISATWGFVNLWYDVVYVSGRNPVPASLLHAVQLMVGHMWQTQRGGSIRRQMGNDQGPPPGSGFLLPYRVAELIEPHLQTGFA